MSTETADSDARIMREFAEGATYDEPNGKLHAMAFQGIPFDEWKNVVSISQSNNEAVMSKENCEYTEAARPVKVNGNVVGFTRKVYGGGWAAFGIDGSRILSNPLSCIATSTFVFRNLRCAKDTVKAVHP
jgi:hypothetical protein